MANLAVRTQSLIFPKLYKQSANITQGKYDFETIHNIVNTTQVLHVSFPTPDPEDPFPAMIPMLGFMGSFEDQNASLSEQLDLYRRC